MKVSIVLRAGSTVATIGEQEFPLSGLEVEPSLEVGVSPQVVLRLPADLDIDVDGVVYVEREPSDGEVRATAASWIREADVDGVRALVEARLITMRDNPIDKTLEVLAELIGGGNGSAR